AAEDLVNTLFQSRDRGDMQQLVRSAVELERFLRMRQAVVRRQRRDVRQLRLLGAEKLATRRHVVEEIADGDPGTAGEGRFLTAQQFAACKLDQRPRGFLRRPCLE